MKKSLRLKAPISQMLFIWVLMLLSGCNNQDQQEKPIPRPVKIFRVENNSNAIAASYAGEVKPRYETTLAFRVAGKVTARLVEVGDRVRKGQLLAKLDAKDNQLAVLTLKAQIKSASAERDFAKNDLIRYQELLDQKVISPPDYERHKTAYTSAEERLSALNAQLGQISNQLDYTALLADRDGVITALEAERGQVVAVGQPIVKLAQLDRKEIYFDVPEQRIAEITYGLDVQASLWADNNRKLQAQIREIAATADPASRTYRVKATLQEGLENVHLGMTATVWIPSVQTEIIAIPLSAVFTSQAEPKQQKVWLVDEGAGRVKSVPVQMGTAITGERVAVKGLLPGQLIVCAGVQRLREGQEIRLPDNFQNAANEKSLNNRGVQP